MNTSILLKLISSVYSTHISIVKNWRSVVTQVCQAGNLVFSLWQDNRPVTIDVTITNAYVLYQFIPQMDRKALPLKEFQTKIARKLIGNYNSRKQVGRPRQMPLPRISAGIQTLSHFPRKIQKENAMLATPLGIAMNVGFDFATAGLTVTASCCTTSRSSCTTEWLS